MILDLTDDEKLALAGLLKRAIADDRFPLSPRVLTLQAILDKIEPPRPSTSKPVPVSKPGDRPRRDEMTAPGGNSNQSRR